MTSLIDTLTPDGDTERVGSRLNRIDPDNFRNQSGAAIEDDDESTASKTEESGLFDENSDPTDVPDHGEHDHHQDDNYALGGHVTRSGSV